MTAFEIGEQAKGWLHPEEGPALYDLASECDGPYMEIGTYCGKSACYIGQAAKEQNTVLFAVDHHRGSPEMHGKNADCYDEAVVVDGQHDSLYQLRQTLRRAELEEVVIPVVGDSRTVGHWWTISLGFLFIDGLHTEQGARSDYELFAPRVRNGGVLVFHDATDQGPGRAAQQAKDDGWTELERVGCMRIFRREP